MIALVCIWTSGPQKLLRGMGVSIAEHQARLQYLHIDTSTKRHRCGRVSLYALYDLRLVNIIDDIWCTRNKAARMPQFSEEYIWLDVEPCRIYRRIVENVVVCACVWLIREQHGIDCW